MSAVAKPLMSLDDALAIMLSHVQSLASVETVATWDADGRMLAEDVVSELAVPALDNSSMDGYALRCSDVPHVGSTLRVTQRIAAGSHGQPLHPGEAARIFTGAPIPPGADAVVMQEHVSVDPFQPEIITINQTASKGQWIRRAGEDVSLGAVILPRGCRLQPAELGLAASIGRAELAVVRKPRVALLSTGDELIMPGSVAPADMKPGTIYNSNRFFLRALLQRAGCEVTDLGIVPDKLDATIAALAAASQTHDLILTSGGVSVGEEDHIKPAVQALGELKLWQMAIKPGKPFAYGRVQASSLAPQAHFIGLPGNPVSSFVTFLLLVRPFVLKLQGATALAPAAMPAVARFSWPKADKRREFLRVKLLPSGGLELFDNQSSGVLTSVVWGDGLVDNPPGQVIVPGDIVRFLPFSALLS